MSNPDKDSKNFLMGALIGGALGIGAIAIYLASKKNDKNSSLNSLGRILDDVGEVLDSTDVKQPRAMLKRVDKRIQKEESKITDVLSWAAEGIQLWKKLKEGG